MGSRLPFLPGKIRRNPHITCHMGLRRVRVVSDNVIGIFMLVLYQFLEFSSMMLCLPVLSAVLTNLKHSYSIGATVNFMRESSCISDSRVL